MNDETRRELAVVAQWRLGWPARDIAETFEMDIREVYRILIKRKIMRQMPSYLRGGR